MLRLLLSALTCAVCLFLCGCGGGGDDGSFLPGQSTPLAGTYTGTYTDSTGNSGRTALTIGTRGALSGSLTVGTRIASITGSIDHDNNFQLNYIFLDDNAALHIHGELSPATGGIAGTGTRDTPGPLTFVFSLNKM
jgi:hypothetical protein